MAEVTINIESSLAAMAFVVADQQDTIKTYRNEYARLEKKAEQLEEKLYDAEQKCEQQSALMDKMRGETKDARMERDKFGRDLANKEEECAVLHQKNDELNADIEEFYAAREVLQNDYKNLMHECNESKREVEKYKRDLCRGYLADFQWEPWPEGTDYIIIPFGNLTEKNCFPVALVMYEMKDGYAPNSPTDETYRSDTPFVEMYPPSINFEKRTATIYANCSMKPRLFALVYPKDLMTKDAIGRFELERQGDKTEQNV